MREILFRGKRIDDGEWVEGFYVRLGNKSDYILTGKLSIVGFAFVYEHHPVIHETVGQYTGLVDRNGVKIFEGDILQTASEDWVRFVVPVVNYKRRDPYWGDLIVDVIGNIHDNPELIGGDP